MLIYFINRAVGHLGPHGSLSKKYSQLPCQRRQVVCSFVLPSFYMPLCGTKPDYLKPTEHSLLCAGMRKREWEMYNNCVARVRTSGVFSVLERGKVSADDYTQKLGLGYWNKLLLKYLQRELVEASQWTVEIVLGEEAHLQRLSLCVGELW